MLTSTNYCAWRAQFDSLLIGYDLYGFVDGSRLCPPVTIIAPPSTIALPNPAYMLWIRQDQLLLNAIIGSLTATLVPFIAAKKTSLDAWKSLEKTYASLSRGRIMELHGKLANPIKGSRTITEYMLEIQACIDSLALMNKPVDFDELSIRILNGLDDSYTNLSSALQARETPIEFDELFEKLLQVESQLALLAKSVPSHSASAFAAPMASGSSKSSTNYTSNNRSLYQSHNRLQQHHNSNRITLQGSLRGPAPAAPQSSGRGYLGRCQVCGVTGHSARQCRLVPSQIWDSIPAPPRGPRPPPRVNTATHYSSPHSESDWVVDSGASHHVTTDLANLSLHQPYTDSDNVVIGDGTCLPIKNTGSMRLSTNHNPVLLTNVLHVPSMSLNLVSVSALCATNAVNVIFLDDCFQVQDRQTGVIMVTGQRKDGVYLWPKSTTPTSNNQVAAFSSFKKSSSLISLWHSRLGHPSAKIFSQQLSSLGISFSHSVLNNFSCNSCFINKMHKLPFFESTVTSNSPLELIYSDVWTSPVHALDGYKYYVIFVDHFTKYIWFYPLHRKSDVYDIFVKFKKLVENYFSRTIKTLYTDRGGEFLALRHFLSNHGISHLTTPPHTPEHNGYSERRHRHIVETGLALLHCASLPITFWSYAFATAVYLINRMPKVNLQSQSSYERLFRRKPNSKKLRVFGCLCFPWLRPYTKHKLDPRSSACLFLGYSLTQSAFICLDLSSQKIIVSRHVKFIENEFPYPDTAPGLSPSLDPLITASSWLSPALVPVNDDPAPTTSDPQLNQQPPPASTTLLDSGSPSTDPESCQLSNPGLVPAVSTLGAPVIDPGFVTVAPTLPDSGCVPESRSESQPLPPVNSHPMTTRFKNAIVKPNPKYGLSTTLSGDTEPTSVSQAVKSPHWLQAMNIEYQALIRNKTWTLVPPDPRQNLVGNKWVFRIKRHPDGSIERYKARLVAKGFHQGPGVEFHETFSPVINPVTVRTVLTIALHKKWDVRQLDVNNAFLNGRLTEEVYMAQPQGMRDPDFPNHVCCLQKAIYGLKQAPRAWYNELRAFLLSLGFHTSQSDTSLFVLTRGSSVTYFLVYVDDLLITGSDPKVVVAIIRQLDATFSTKDLGLLSFFCGVEVLPTRDGILLSQHKYVVDLLRKHNMLDSKPVSTPLAVGSPLTLHDGAAKVNSTMYR